MSLILDALHKADQERDGEDDTPTLNAIHGPVAQRRNATTRWRWISLLLSIIVVVFGGLFFISRGSEVPPAVADMASAQPQSLPRPVQELPASSQPEPASDLPPRSQPVQRPAVTPGTPAPAEITRSEAEPQPVVEANPFDEEEDSQTGVRSLYGDGADTAVAASSSSSDAVATEQEIARIVEAAAAGAAAESANASLPLITSLPQRVKDAIPSIRYSGHRYAGPFAANYVVLNGASLAEGDRVADNLKLVEILEDSIVLDYKGRQFRLIKLNNWINL